MYIFIILLDVQNEDTGDDRLGCSSSCGLNDSFFAFQIIPSAEIHVQVCLHIGFVSKLYSR